MAMALMGKKVAAAGMLVPRLRTLLKWVEKFLYRSPSIFRSLFTALAIKSDLTFHSTNHSHSRDGGDRLHVLVVGHAGLAVGPVLEARLHEGKG